MSIFDQLDLSGQSALITGASRGIGAACARSVYECGATVWLSGRDVAALDATASACPEARVIVFDVTDPQAVKDAIMTIRKQSGQLDILVNNAGIMHGAMIAATSDRSLQEMLDVNVAGAYRMAQYAARLMSAKGRGSIVNMASIMGCAGASGYSAYSATKAAVIGMTRAMARELAPRGVRVNALAPGFIETDLTTGISGESREKVLSQIGMGRFGTPEDVARVALFLASPLSGYVTGQVIGVDGMMVT
jgi:3-oxoacyl-[acyl-carrier protein] reductase